MKNLLVVVFALVLLVVVDAGSPHSRACYKSLGQLCFPQCIEDADDVPNPCANPSGLDHPKYIRQAIALARSFHKFFAAVIVDRNTGIVVATGVNTGTSHFPIGHGEIRALINFTNIFPNIIRPFSNYVLYTTGEPCPMCASALHYSGFSEVIWASSIAQLIDYGWNQINIKMIEVINADIRGRPKACLYGGVLANESKPLFFPYPNTPIPLPVTTPQCTPDQDDQDNDNDSGGDGQDQDHGHGGDDDRRRK